MNLGELKTAFRNDVDDTATPYLWSDEELERYLNDAEREACRRARLLVDSDVAEICKINVTAGKSTYELDNRIIFIRRAKLTSQSRPLTRMSFRDMDEFRPGWESSTASRATHFITDWKTGHIRIFPTPTQADTLWLTGVRLPMQDMADQYDEPEINVRYHESLVHWAKHRAYLKKDAETLNEAESKKHLDAFEKEFGPKSSAVEEEWIERQQQSDPYDGTF